MARKNIKVPESLFLALRDDKADGQSWPHYLEEQCLHDSTDFESALQTIEERTGRIERQLEEMQR